MQNIIDTFADNYHWSKDNILELYPDEIPIYYKRIAERNNIKIASRKKDIVELAMMFIQSFHTDKPQDIYTSFEKYGKELDSIIYKAEMIKEKEYYEVDKPEIDKLEQLKRQMGR